MPLFMIEQPIIALNPNRPKNNAMEKMPNLDFSNKLLRNVLPKEGLFPMKIILVVGFNDMEFMHDEGSHLCGL